MILKKIIDLCINYIPPTPVLIKENVLNALRFFLKYIHCIKKRKKEKIKARKKERFLNIEEMLKNM